MKKSVIMAGMALMMAACGGNEKEYDATGTFEATETTVYAEQSGVLLSFSVNEGDNIEANKEVGLIDTTQTWLKILQLNATKEVYQSQKPDMERQIAATRQQLAKARQDEQRYKELVADGAAPSKMLDDASSQVKVLQKQLDAQISSPSTSTRSLVCENGPCPRSCSSIASFAPRHSSSLISTPFWRSTSSARPIRFKAPSIWLNRVCIAPGYTRKVNPSCFIRRCRWKNGCPITLSITGSSTLRNPS